VRPWRFESGSNDPFAVLLTILLIEFLLLGEDSWQHVLGTLAMQAVLGGVLGIFGRPARSCSRLNRLGAGAGPACAVRGHQRAGDLRSRLVSRHASGFLAVYLGRSWWWANRPHARPTIPWWWFLDAVTWLAQIVMFVLLGLLAWPDRLAEHALAGARDRSDVDDLRPPGGRIPLPCAVPVFPGARSCSSPGSDCAERSAFSWRQFP